MRLPIALFIAFLSISHAISLPFLERQDATRGRCPSKNGKPGRICGSNQLCCPNRCCPKTFPYCGGDQCVTADGFVRCPTEDGKTRRGRLCSNNSGFCCIPPYGFCSDTDPIHCVNSEGYVACRDSATGEIDDGRLCPDGICCVLPRKCCKSEIDGKYVCCENKGEDIRLDRAPTLQGVPATEPIPLETAEATDPGMDKEPPVGGLPGTPDVPENGEETPSDGGSNDGPSDDTMETTPGAEMSPDVDEEVEQAEETPEEDDGSVCLPGDAKVEVRGVGVTEVANVRSGDVVRVSGGEWSEVFMWTHKDGSYRGRRFVEVWAEGMLKVTEGHMVYVCREMKEDCEREIVRVESVNVGDGMWRLESEERLVRVEKVMKGVSGWGLYNPQTASGDIVVDGMVITCYSRWIKESVAHGLLAPIRALYKWSGFALEVSL